MVLMSYMWAALLHLDMRYRKLLSHHFDLLLDLSLHRDIQIRQRCLVDDGKFQSSAKIREKPPGFVFGDRRRTLMPEESSDRFLSQADFLSRDPQSIDVLITRSSHTAELRIGKRG